MEEVKNNMITYSPSPNFYERNGYKPELIVIHCTDGNFPGDKEWLISPKSQVSAHFLIAPNGETYQLVDPKKAAWHAGRVDKPTAKLKKNFVGSYVNPNLYSIGIEVSLRPPQEMPVEQRGTLVDLVRTLAKEYSIPLDRDHVVGHREIYSLKTCPGTIDVDSIVKEAGPLEEETNEGIKKQIVALLDKIK